MRWNWPHNESISRQQGYMLIMAMVALVVITILGLSSMSSSNLDLRMSGNAMENTVAFNNAEDVRNTAINTALAIRNQMETNALSFNAAAQAAGLSRGYYDLSNGWTGPGVDLVEFWNDANNYVQVGAAGSGYAIEYAGAHAVYLNRLTAAAGGDEAIMYMFRLTVAGQGADGARTVLQSVYLRN